MIRQDKLWFETHILTELKPITWLIFIFSLFQRILLQNKVIKDVENCERIYESYEVCD
jgi:hypothetical protein